MTASRLRLRLCEGDRRERGAAGAVADGIIAEPDTLGELIVLLNDDDPSVVAHAAHAAMQISTRRPDLFDAYVDDLLVMLDRLRQWELGEQLPKILVRSKLTNDQARRLYGLLLRHLDSRFNIVAACSLQAIIDLAGDQRISKDEGRAALEKALASERKALSARARKLDREIGGFC